ncbi:MAG TPA: class I SAM-dependent methyltransferase [Burkholderiales bacterium]|nr:class I SAM-dependent methyltransferase [Burkholderiales bacterium]
MTQRIRGQRRRVEPGAAALILQAGREKSLLRRHPWVFSGAIERLEGDPAIGETVAVRAADGRFLARAGYSPQSQIRARVWSFDEVEPIDAAFFRARVGAAVARRAALAATTDAVRLVHGEADGLPGVVCDRYADVAVLQLSSAGAERWRDSIADAVIDASGASAVYERSDLEVRELEGLPARAGALRGAPAEIVTIAEHGIRYRVDTSRGQKTGFYLDQRANRDRIRTLAAGRDVLNAFCYTGGFSLNALVGGARSVVSLDTSAAALELARGNLALNGLDVARAAWREADVFNGLRELRSAGCTFDLVVLDPPKFAPTAAHVARAARAYKDINLLALKLLRPGGLLATFSCSGAVPQDLFQKIVAAAAADAAVDAVVCERFHADADHPVALSFPEGEYLKGLLLEKR